MNAVDTNILVYRLDPRDPVKQGKARTLLRTQRRSRNTVIPWQVIGEFLRQLQAWKTQGQIHRSDVTRHLNFVRKFFAIVMPKTSVLDHALDLSDRFSLSHWDSMLLAACLDAGVDTLFTEDMGSPTRYDTVQLENPFI